MVAHRHEAASRVERRVREAELMYNDTEQQALLRSQSASLAGAAFAAVPTSFHTRLAPFVLSVASSPSPSSSHVRMFADVAAFSILLASIVLLARRQECCREGLAEEWPCPDHGP